MSFYSDHHPANWKHYEYKSGRWYSWNDYYRDFEYADYVRNNSADPAARALANSAYNARRYDESHAYDRDYSRNTGVDISESKYPLLAYERTLSAGAHDGSSDLFDVNDAIMLLYRPFR